jgi:hypothetical protein
MICEVPEGKKKTKKKRRKKGEGSDLLWNLRDVWAKQCPMLPAA